MALTAGRWFTVFELVETSGKRTRKRFEQSAPLDDTAARASAAAMATDLAAVTNAEIASYYTYQEFVEDALVLPTGAELQNQAILTCGIEDAPTKSGTIVIPAPVDGIFVDSSGAGYDVVDTTDADLLAFFANFDSEALFYVSDGEQADGLIGGRRRHVKSTSS